MQLLSVKQANGVSEGVFNVEGVPVKNSQTKIAFENALR